MRVGLWWFFFFQAEDGIRDLVRSRGLGDVYKRQVEAIRVTGTGQIDVESCRRLWQTQQMLRVCGVVGKRQVRGLGDTNDPAERAGIVVAALEQSFGCAHAQVQAGRFPFRAYPSF